LCYAEIISWSGIGKAGWASQVASGGNFNKTNTGVLLVLGTQAAIEWTAILNLCGKVVWDSPRFIILERVQVPFGIGGHQRLVPTVIRAPLAKVDSAVTDEYLSIYYPETIGAYTARDFI
jgi:hypothetical protein